MIGSMRRSALRAIESAKPLTRASSVSRSFATFNDTSKVQSLNTLVCRSYRR